MNAIEASEHIADLEHGAAQRGEEDYRAGTLALIESALQGSESFAEARTALGAHTLERMDADGLAGHLAEAAVVASAVGTIGALPADPAGPQPEEWSQAFAGFLQGE